MNDFTDQDLAEGLSELISEGVLGPATGRIHLPAMPESEVSAGLDQLLGPAGPPTPVDSLGWFGWHRFLGAGLLSAAVFVVAWVVIDWFTTQPVGPNPPVVQPGPTAGAEPAGVPIPVLQLTGEKFQQLREFVGGVEEYPQAARVYAAGKITEGSDTGLQIVLYTDNPARLTVEVRWPANAPRPDPAVEYRFLGGETGVVRRGTMSLVQGKDTGRWNAQVELDCGVLRAGWAGTTGFEVGPAQAAGR